MDWLISHPGDAIWAPGSFVIGCDAYFLLGENNNYNNPILPIAMYKYKQIISVDVLIHLL